MCAVFPQEVICKADHLCEIENLKYQRGDPYD